ncbi:MAG TPA: hypothetical protein VF727_09565 [Allosphingosinicella sp.]|jgi:alkylhydroperoxidase family enzyme
MLKRFFTRRIDRFEREWGYDSGHLREVLSASERAFAKIALIGPLIRHREDVPDDLHWAAALTATAAAGCEPCLALVVEMARRSGLGQPLMDAILAGDAERMTAAAAIGYRFATAVTARDAVAAGRTRGEVLRQWGRKAVVSLSITVATASFYPSLKYGVGKGRVTGGLGAAVARRRAAA